MLAVILVALSAMLIPLAARTGLTVDEPSHLLSSYLYWRGQDRLQPGDMPPLIKMLSGWAPLHTGLPLPPDDHPVWKTGHEWPIAQETIGRFEQQPLYHVLFLSRLPMIIFPLGCCLLLWWWARQIFDPQTGLAVAALAALTPTLLGHGCLLKNDVAAAFAYLLFWYRAWRFWLAPGWMSSLSLGLALLLALLTKFSMLVLAPVAPLLVLVRLVRLRPTTWVRALGAMALVALIVYSGVYAAWQFDSERLQPSDFERWSSDARVPTVLTRSIERVQWLPLPARFWRGAVSLVQSNRVSSVYLLGTTWDEPQPLYFPVTMVAKVPLIQQLLLLAGLLALALTRRRSTDLFWILPGFVYLGLASLSNLQLGFRLILPSTAFFLLISGAGLRWILKRPFGRTAVPALLAALALSVGWAWPNYISFYSVFFNSPQKLLSAVSDSNIDWGQDLHQLPGVMRNHGIPRIRLAYFGLDNPWFYLHEDELDVVAPPWTDELVNGRLRYQPEPGHYAISAMLLTGQVFQHKYRDFFAEFRQRTPLATAGNSIFVYRIP